MLCACDVRFICPQRLHIFDLRLYFRELAKVPPAVGVNVSVTAGAILFVKVSFCLMRQTTSTSALSITLENRRCSPFSVAAWRILKFEGVTTIVKADIGIPAGAISRIDAGPALNKSGASFIHLL